MKKGARKASSTAGSTQVALLRGINVGGHRKVPMSELRDLAAGLGWHLVETYIQSGNVVFTAKARRPALERKLEEAIEEEFGFTVPVVVRSAVEWLALAKGSPFPAAETERPNLLHLGLSKEPPRAGAAKELARYCQPGERLLIRGDAIWTDFAKGVARSKLTPAVLDRVIGSSVTSRNWKTVQKLAEMVRSTH